MPEPYYQSGDTTLYCGDNRDVLPALDVAVSAVITDPPYGLGFMGKAWDHGVPGVPFWQAIRDRMQPGAHLLAFGGTRTFHRMGVAIEDAGFEIKDTLSWLYGSGFPKHKSLLKPGWEPIILARKPGKGVLNIDACRIGLPEDKRAAGTRRYTPSQMAGKEPGDGGERLQLAPHDGLGRWPANVLLDEDTAVMLDAQSGERKSGGYPPAGGQRSHMATYGNPNERGDQRFTASTGGASRFFYVAAADEKARHFEEFMVQCDCNCEATEGDEWARPDHQASTPAASDTPRQRDTTGSTSGMASEAAPSWPTSLNGNGTTDLSPTAIKSTTSTSTSRTTGSRTCNCSIPSPTSGSIADANSGTACGGSPANSAESSSPSTPSTGTSAVRAGRSTVDAGPATSARSLLTNSVGAPSARFQYVPKASRAERNAGLPEGMSCTHPTVKPLGLMRWLITLVTPPGGVVLDPFAGSGSTLVAAAHLGIPAIGIEQSEEYCEIAARRIDHALAQARQLEMVAD